MYRKEQYHFEKCLYVTGLEQSLHFKQIFKAIEVMGYDWADGLVHVPEDILKEAIERAYNAIMEKNPPLVDKEATAKKVGVGAIIFHDLFNQRIGENGTTAFCGYRAEGAVRGVWFVRDGMSGRDVKLHSSVWFIFFEIELRKSDRLEWFIGKSVWVVE